MQRLNQMPILNLAIPILLVVAAVVVFADGPRQINITATKDNKFKVEGEKEPVIVAKPGEVLKLHITTFKGPEYEKDGTAHSITIKEFKDQGWDLRLKEGVKDYTVVVPDKPGEYVSECVVKCGKGHDDMKLKLVVKP